MIEEYLLHVLQADQFFACSSMSNFRNIVFFNRHFINPIFTQSNPLIVLSTYILILLGVTTTYK